ncbi:glutathione transferase GstA [Burkholderia oklahomensis]|uniref:Glutathione transferase n=1 Tax=Burkholderia oklahomensis TaxID=342113 RepID=A0AAI8FLC4_9BURK|nr:glutathione transferase GstA [Burkholderia oklahomensis]AIO65356.1 hypothetical protein DM82_1998 [Burkholderia oklahomensis]AJX32829.1 glutathione S-transferase [Burkholderia oklahomensis C6786]AOI41807.1 glutathione S-transferase [Burkholderia oklahomensis EO147]AOI45396.1 glutathione S-transferase [Burkholderia oklahomensis C6786]KUY58787.1 glutathione S-transferase [Burkholderia oklahomensis C6786]
MKLYYSPGACSLAVRIALTEGGIPFEGVKVDLQKHELADGSDYYAISPRGYVPLVEFDDGSRHTEAAALLQRIGDLVNAGALIPVHGTAERYDTIEWLSFVATELHKSYGWLWRKDTADSTRQACVARIDTRLKDVDAHLEGRDYLIGRFTVADIYLFTIVNWSNFLQLPLDAYPRVRAFMERVAARPKVREALVAEGLAQ